MTKFVIDNSKKKHAFGQFFPPQGSPIALCQSFDGIGGITFISSSVRPPDAITRSSAAALERLDERRGLRAQEYRRDRVVVLRKA